MENEQMNTELHFQSRETEKLIDRNQSLLDENAQLRRNLLIHKDLENELARRTHVYQKLIKNMDRKNKAEQVTMEHSRDLGLSIDGPLREEPGSPTGSASAAASAQVTEENTQLKRQMEG